MEDTTPYLDKNSYVQPYTLDDCGEENMIVKDHLIILVHGLHGGKGDLEFLRTCLERRFQRSIAVCATSNDGFLKTHEGLEAQGERLADEVLLQCNRYHS